MRATTHPAMSSSSSDVVHVAGANRGVPQPLRQYRKQKPTGAPIALAEGTIQPGNCADVAVAVETVCGVVGKSSWTKKNSTANGYPATVLRCRTRVLQRRTPGAVGVCESYRSKNNVLVVFRTPGGVLGTCFAL